MTLFPGAHTYTPIDSHWYAAAAIQFWVRKMWSVASRLVGPFASRVLASTPYIGRYLTVY